MVLSSYVGVLSESNSKPNISYKFRWSELKSNKWTGWLIIFAITHEYDGKK